MAEVIADAMEAAGLQEVAGGRQEDVSVRQEAVTAAGVAAVASAAEADETPHLYRDGAAALRALQLAVQAAARGTYGVGAVLLDATGAVVCEGHNEVSVRHSMAAQYDVLPSSCIPSLGLR